MFCKVEPELWVFKDVTHDCLERHASVGYWSGLAACVDMDANRVEAIVTVDLLEEEVTVLGPVLVTMIEDVVVDFFDLVEEV